jgi:hypothetical protein
MTKRRLDDDEPATRGMLKDLATKDMLKDLATKDMLKDLATKDMVEELRVEVKAEFTALESRMIASDMETRRHFDVVGESLRDDIRLIADGLAANTVVLQRVVTTLESTTQRTATTELRVDDHERRISGLEHPPSPQTKRKPH